jgi:hypothetical protein
MIKLVLDKHTIKEWVAPLFLLIICLCMFGILWQKLSFIQHSHFSDLAYSFLHGKLSLPDSMRFSSWQDSSFFNGKHYVYFGLTPTLLLLPAVIIFGQNFPQQTLCFVAGIINFLLLLKIGIRLGLKPKDAFWLTLATIFGSSYFFVSIINISAFLVQVVGMTFMLFALYEYLTSKRWFLIGIWIALAGLTRQSLYACLIFYLFELFISSDKNKKRSLFLLLSPIFYSLILTGVYNFSRFASIINNGYLNNPTWPCGKDELAKYGLFSLTYLPSNLFIMLLKGPESLRINEASYVLRFPYIKASEWGMSIFITSPFLLFGFLSKLNNPRVKGAMIACIIGILPSLVYACTGAWQYGYRYILDIWPFIFIILATYFSANGVTKLAKLLIALSILGNLFFSGSIWGVYPFTN